MTQTLAAQSRGTVWMSALTGRDGLIKDEPATVRVVDALLGSELTRFIAVVPDGASRFTRARHGEVGLQEAWSVARQVLHVISEDTGKARRPIIAVVDVSSQAYGRLEELLGLHAACAAAAEAYATARLAGHPVVALLVGKAMSGAFLAHGYQANRIIALDDPGVVVHAMGQLSAARITRRSLEDLESSARKCPPMAYDIRSYAQWGLLHCLLEGVDADRPTGAQIDVVRDALLRAVADIRHGPNDLSCRLQPPGGKGGRAASLQVRALLAQQWNDI